MSYIFANRSLCMKSQIALNVPRRTRERVALFQCVRLALRNLIPLTLAGSLIVTMWTTHAEIRYFVGCSPGSFIGFVNRIRWTFLFRSKSPYLPTDYTYSILYSSKTFIAKPNYKPHNPQGARTIQRMSPIQTVPLKLGPQTNIPP